MDDLISRQAAIDAMNVKLEDIKLRWRGKVKKGEIAMYLDMRGTIETLPSAQPDAVLVVQGEWIDEDYYSQDKQHKVYRCSKCGWHMVSRPTELFNYCPSCGAKQSWVKDETES